MRKCETCAYWREIPKEMQDRVKLPLGFCFLKPPVLMLMPVPPSPGSPHGGMQMQGFRPQTLSGDGCGNHQLEITLQH